MYLIRTSSRAIENLIRTENLITTLSTKKIGEEAEAILGNGRRRSSRVAEMRNRDRDGAAVGAWSGGRRRGVKAGLGVGVRETGQKPACVLQRWHAGQVRLQVCAGRRLRTAGGESGRTAVRRCGDCVRRALMAGGESCRTAARRCGDCAVMADG